MREGREVGPADLMDVAKDEDRARSLHRTLRSLSAGSDPKLREMATAVLRGDLTAQEAFTDPEYTAALFTGAAEVRRSGEKRSAEEAREAGEGFDAWQRERRAEDWCEDVGQDVPRPIANAPASPGTGQHTGPWRHSGLGGRDIPRLGGSFRHR